jgi:peroxiredoxin
MKKFIIIVTLFYCFTSLSQDQMYDVCPLKVGEEIPQTSLTNIESKTITLASITSKKPTVIVFYRGAWCGYRTKHLAELNDSKEEIEKLGYQIIGITVDKAEKLYESSERAKSEIEVYSDAKLETILAFGLDWKIDSTLFQKYKNEYKLDVEEWSGEDHHSLPVPAIFIIQNNIVVFQYVNPNYKTRLKAETLLAVLRTL